MNLGLATYGRAFTLADPNKINLYDPILGGGNPGPYTNQSGFLGYNEVSNYVKTVDFYSGDIIYRYFADHVITIFIIIITSQENY